MRMTLRSWGVKSRAGASLPKMQEVSRQKKLEVLLGYIRSAELFEDHAGGGFL